MSDTLAAADALHDEEVERTRAFLRIGWAVALGVIAATLLVPGDRTLRIALLAGIGVAVLGSLWIHAQLRDPARYDPRTITMLALVCVVCGQLGILYVGYFSAAALIVELGLCFFCRTESLGAAIAIYVLAAGAHAIEAGLVITGVIRDPGFYPVRHDLPLIAQIVGHLIVQQGYATCFWLARLTRSASLQSIEQLQAATRLAAQREVQLDELREDLDRALKIGGPGRFTGHVVGSWELGVVIGRGGMGEVYEATRSGGGDGIAAVKLLRRELLSDAKTVARFLREVRVASAFESPNVVKVLEASSPDDPLPFLAMERLRGHTLGELIRGAGVFPADRIAELVGQITGALEHARAAELVHRDLKPHNLFVTDDGTWKVLDFGIALLGSASGTLTQGAVVGTPAFMAPEQARGEPVDHRADVYAFGAVLYRCLTGQPLYVATDSPSLLYAIVHDVPVRPSALVSIARDLEHVLALALAKSRDDRFQSAAELGAAYAAASRGSLDDELRFRARRLRAWREPDTAATVKIRMR